MNKSSIKLLQYVIPMCLNYIIHHVEPYTEWLIIKTMGKIRKKLLQFKCLECV